MVLVKVLGISVYYGNRIALNDIEFEVFPGEIISVIGPNGSGKTTLLKTIDGILSFSKGSIYIDHKDIKNYVRKELAKILSYVPQRIDVATYLTVLDFVLTGRRPYALFNYSKKDLDKVIEVLQLVEAKELMYRRLDHLSSGELQRIVIARALVVEPKVLLLDEPTSNLDPKYQIEILKIIKNLVKEKRIAVIMAIHDLTHAYRFSDKILMLKNGNIVAFGKPDDVFTTENIEKVFGIKTIIDKKLKIVVIEF